MLKIPKCFSLTRTLSFFVLFILILIPFNQNYLFSLDNTKEDLYLEFFQKYRTHYQDIIIKNRVVAKGSNLCDARYELIKPILDQYVESFSVLDIGACEGYFSFRIASDYPAICHMIEGGYYKKKPEKLFDLCCINNLSNTYLMYKRLDLDSLYELSKQEHFDVVIAFLVIHQMSEQNHPFSTSFLERAKKIIQILQNLGTNLIIETSTEIYPEIDTYVMQLCTDLNGIYLGELPRMKTSANSKANGRFYWFKSSYSGPTGRIISDQTFNNFNGIFPEKNNHV